MPRSPGQAQNRNRMHLAPPLQVLARQDLASQKGLGNYVHFRKRATCKPKGMPLPPRHRHRLPTRFLKAFPLGGGDVGRRTFESSLKWPALSFIGGKCLPHTFQISPCSSKMLLCSQEFPQATDEMD